MNILVGNLSPRTTEAELRAAFERFGRVEDVRLMRDRLTGRSRRCGVVAMRSTQEAESALRALNGHLLNERALSINLCYEPLEAPAQLR